MIVMPNAFRSSAACAAACCVVILSAAAVIAQAKATEKSIVLNGRFGQIVSEAVSKPGSPQDVELGQEVRVDPLASSDPDWDGATVTIYEQSLSYPSHGTYRSYGVINTKTGDKAFVELDGKWDVANRDGQAAEASFEGQGKVVGGTGKLEGISGPLTVKGTVKDGEGGRYSVTINSSR